MVCEQLVKNSSAVRETWVWSLVWEDPLEKAKATTPVFWPREFHGLYMYSPWGCKELDMTKKLCLATYLSLHKKWSEEVVKSEFFMLGSMKGGRLWENVIGPNSVWAKHSKLREAVRPVNSDSSWYPSVFEGKHTSFYLVLKRTS